MVTSPTNHTTSAFFGMLEWDDTQSSLDMQSDIEESQILREISTHTSTLMSGMPDPNKPHARVLESVMEEVGVTPSESGEDVFANTENDEETGKADDKYTVPPPPISTSSYQPLHDLIRLQGQDVTAATDTDVSKTRHSTFLGGQSRHSTFHGGQSQRSVSQTRHMSNIDPFIKEHEGPVAPYKRFDKDTDRIAAWAIHLMLIIFGALVVVAVFLAFLVISQYGLVALCGLIMILMFAIFLAWFVDQTILSQNVKLRPIRNKIIKVVQAAKQAVVDEIQLFQLDWNEHKLLTNFADDGEPEEYGPKPLASPTRGTDSSKGPPVNPNPIPESKRRKSVIFRMIKPLLGAQKKIFRRKKRSNKKKAAAAAAAAAREKDGMPDFQIPDPQSPASEYVPPPGGVVV